MFSPNLPGQKRWQQKSLPGLMVAIGIASLMTSLPENALAQISVDSTLGAESSVVVPNLTINDLPAERIDGGAIRGSNLFHSFAELNIAAGQQLFFSNPDGITNILSRVTGNAPSNILGTLGVLGNANLFLLNPNGILFGPNARLAVGGSFMATTAAGVLFADGTEFRSDTPTSALLTVSVPIGLSFGPAPGAIAVQGPGHSLRSNVDTGEIIRPPDPAPVGLQVPSGKTLALVGGDVVLTGGLLSAPAGRIELGSISGPATVGLSEINQGWALSYSPTQSGGTIQLSQRSLVDASGEGGGNIQLQARQVQLSEASVIVAETLGALPGGTVVVNASELLQLVGTSTDELLPTGLITQSESTGKAGDLVINTEHLIVQGGASISASTVRQGQGGNLVVNAESIELVGTSATGVFVSSLVVRTTGEGNAGALSVNTERLVVRDGASISASTRGRGQGGTLTINAANSTQLIGTSKDGSDRSSLVVRTTGSGNAGTLTVNTGQLIVQDGAVVAASTRGSGQGGRLIINAAESVQLTGISINGVDKSSLVVRSQSSGDGGNLQLTTGQLLVQDRAEISVGSSGSGDGGNLEIAAASIYLNGGTLTAATASGEGGNIALQVQNELLLQNNSSISATAGGTGNGGNITITTGFLIASPAENNDIIASAVRGQGGNIQIRTQEILGLEFRDRPTAGSDITASSEFGVSGIVNIDTQTLNPNQGVIPLPVEVVDVSKLVAQGCTVGKGATVARFINTGRSGLPASPEDLLSSQAVWEDTRLLTTTASVSAPTATPAQGWVINNQGEVTLVAQAPVSSCRFNR